MIEILAPAGNLERLKTAVHFGADAVYLAGKKYGLRAQSDNFDLDELESATKFAHARNKKVYVALNIFAYDEDFINLDDYIRFLYKIKVDAVIVSDAGIIAYIKKIEPNLKIHISTQSNITNKYAAKFWAEQGAERIVAARELSLEKIREMRDFLPPEVSIEAFVHGAMCISYSGRCLLSNYLTNRASNHGECAQSCRWEYTITEKKRQNSPMEIIEDNRGTYILNSKDMNMIAHIDKLIEAGIESFKIEGRVKTAYYVANTVNAYRRALDLYNSDPDNFVITKELSDELYKSSHRSYCTGFYFDDPDMQFLEHNRTEADYKFCGIVLEAASGGIIIEQRNRFKKNDSLEILSPSDSFNKIINVEYMTDELGNEITDANNVQQKIFIKTKEKLLAGDILRIKE